MTSNEELLAGVPIFSMLKPKALQRLAVDAHDVTYPAGKTLTEADGFGTTFSVVAEGVLHVLVNGELVRTLGPGDYFGEMALIDREARSATVVTGSDVRCLVLTQWAFRPFALEHPEVAWALLEVMVARVREVESR